MTGASQPSLYIVAGPNGAGKSTFARLYLPDYAECREFVNADLIAAGLSPFNPEGQAGFAARSVVFSLEGRRLFERVLFKEIQKKAREE